jgi:agmatinase
MPRYQPTNALPSSRTGTFARLPLATTTEHIDMAVLGIPFEMGESYRSGARFGPVAIRDASLLLRPFNPVLRIDVFRTLSVADGGDIAVASGKNTDDLRQIEEALLPILADNVIPLCLGGDRSITLAELRAVSRRYGPVGLVHLGAHSNTSQMYPARPDDPDAIFRRAVKERLLDSARCMQVGMRGSLSDADEYEAARQFGFALLPATEMRQYSMSEVARMIRDRVGRGPTLLSFDIGFVDPAYAPGTDLPEIGGATSWEALQLLRSLRNLHFVAFDVVEMLPSFDPTQITALLASALAYEMISLVAARRSPSAF